MTEISRQRRREILGAARQLFRQQGIDNTSMAEIARLSGLGKSTLYEYFPSKEALVQVLGQWLLRHYQERMEEVFSPQEPLQVQLCRYLDTVYIHSDGGDGRLAMENLLEMLRICGAKQLQEDYEQAQARVYGQMTRSIRCAVERGELPTGTDPETAARLMLALLNPVTASQLRSFGMEDQARQAVETILRGVAALS